MDETMVRRARVVAQGLGPEADGDAPRAAVDVVRSLLAVQAQDLRGARLALRARSVPAEGLEAALEERSVVVAWLLRGTLHVVAAEDWPWLLALTAPRQEASAARRFGQLGLSPADVDRGVDVIARAVTDAGPLTRAEFGTRLDDAGVRTEGQALPHLLGAAGRRGEIVAVGEHLYAPPPPRREVDRDSALAELARRYVSAHACATDADLAAWSGLPLRDVRAGLAHAAVEPSPSVAPDAPLPPRLLPAFDPYLLGWKDRAFAVPPPHAKRVFPGGGMFRATVIDDGRAIATWTAPGGHVAVEPFDPAAPLPQGLAAAVADVEGCLAP